MPSYVIGDVHGCLDGIFSLLEAIEYNPKNDYLYFLGDLVNKGPDSIGVLSWIMQQKNCKSVIGNHDLFLIHSIVNQTSNPSDTTKSFLTKTDAIDWLCQQPFIIEHQNTLMCHAGIHPKWTDQNISDIVKEQMTFITAEQLKRFYHQPRWQLKAEYNDPLFIMAVLTEMRFLNPINFSLSQGTDDNDPLGQERIAWFDVKSMNHTKKDILFGHWAKLSTVKNHHTTCLDGGFVYGGTLLCQRLDDGKIFKIKHPKQKNV